MNVNKMAEQVNEFQEKIVNIKPSQTGRLSPERWEQRVEHMREELNEASASHHIGENHDVVDGLVDLIYLALGTLLEMGVPPSFAFDTVHEANMRKKQGKSARNGNYEAVKPDGWEPPDHKPLLEKMTLLNEVSPVFVELTKLRIKKGANYNRGTVKREDHFPLGHQSHFQMVWLKAIRLRSFVESLPDKQYDTKDTERLIGRELNDLIVYADFWAKWLKGEKL